MRIRVRSSLSHNRMLGTIRLGKKTEKTSTFVNHILNNELMSFSAIINQCRPTCNLASKYVLK